MKKLIACLLVVTLLGTAVNTAVAEDLGRGGFMGFIAGCCMGIRVAGDYNEGKEIHWREWVRAVGHIPYVGLLTIPFAIWDGVEGADGVTTADYASRYGAMYY